MICLKPALIACAVLLLLCGCEPNTHVLHLCLDVYQASAGIPGVEVPDYKALSAPELFDSCLVAAEALGADLAAWSRLRRLRPLESRRLSCRIGPQTCFVDSGSLQGVQWQLEARQVSERAELHLRTYANDVINSNSPWLPLSDDGAVLGAPLGPDSGLLLQLRHANTVSQESSEPPQVENTFFEVDVQPQPLQSMQALTELFRYPPDALRRGVSGTVVLTAFVDTLGAVNELRLLRSVDAALDSAALADAMQLRFYPARTQGAAIASWVALPVRYVLEK